MEEKSGRGRSLPRRLLQHRLAPRTVRGALALVLALLVLGIGAGLLVVYALSRDLPSPARLATIQPSMKTLVFSADGDTIHEFYRENRVPVRLEDIPEGLVNAVIATEDRDFYDHYGLQVRGMLRAVVVNMQTGTRSQGGSTLTQQLARSLFLHHRKEWTRKIREMLLALQIERSYSKDEILEMYLNTIYFGPAYGVEAASQAYFGKGVAQLTPPEYTMLAGVLNNPGYYSPYRHIDRAYERRGVVLRSMVAGGYLSAAEAESIGQAEVTIRRRGPAERLAPYFVELIRQHLESNYGARALYEDGLRVYTTLDAGLQRAAEASLEEHMQRMEERGNYDEVKAEYDTTHAGDDEAPVPNYLQAALLAMDARTGEVRAMVGGRDYRRSKFNRATQALRQPGSCFKPFLYTAALQRGYTPASVLLDAPVEVDTGADELWRPVNFDQTFRGEVSIRHALAHSINIPAVRLIMEVGPQPVIRVAERMGITSPVPAVYSIALGSAEVTLEEMVAAYSAFANRGLRSRPHYFTRITDSRGDVLEEVAPFQEEVLDERVAWLMADMMGTGLREGTGRSAATYGFRRPGAGKTGTTDRNTDAWFIGYTPELVCGVWTGFDRKESMGRGRTGAVVALPIWANTMVRGAGDIPATPFARPEGIEEHLVCEASGQKPTPMCPDIRPEVFLPGSFPSLLCERHQPGVGEVRGGTDFDDIDAAAGRTDEFGRALRDSSGGRQAP